MVLGFGADRSEAGRGGQARRKYGRAGTVQLWATGTGSRSGKARAFGEKRKAEWSHVTQGPASAELWATGTGSRSGKARAFGEKRKAEWSHVTQGPASAELEVQVRRRERRGKVSGEPR